jgi:hypothetical protein
MSAYGLQIDNIIYYISGTTIHNSRGANRLLWGANGLYSFRKIGIHLYFFNKYKVDFEIVYFNIKIIMLQKYVFNTVWFL